MEHDDEPDVTEPPPSTRRVVWGLAAVLAAVVAVAVVAVLSADDPSDLPADRPEGVVQRFVAAVLAGDDRAARGYLDSGAGSGRCDLTNPDPDAAARVVLRSVTTSDRDSTVRVRISQVEGFGVFGDTSYEDDFELERRAGAWRITWAPWPFADCYVDGKGE